MFVGADYPFLDVLWTMVVIFAWVIWFWLLITVFADVFRRRDTSGVAKVFWIIFVIVLPFLGVFIYLIANHDGMAERNIKQMQAQQAQFDEHVRVGRGLGWCGRRDREGQGPPRLRCDHPGRVRLDQAEGARLLSRGWSAGPPARPTTPSTSGDRFGPTVRAAVASCVEPDVA